MELNPQAKELNELIKEKSETVYELLSKRGKAIFFPKKGILSQTADARGKKYNATIGIALENDGSPLRLKSVEKNVEIKAENAFPYAPSFGRKDLREKWKEMIYEKNPSLKNEISMPIVTNALTHGLSMMGYMFLDEGARQYIDIQVMDDILNQINRIDRMTKQAFKGGRILNRLLVHVDFPSVVELPVETESNESE